MLRHGAVLRKGAHVTRTKQIERTHVPTYLAGPLQGVVGQGERGGRESRFFELPFFVPLLSSCASLVAKRVEYNTREVVVCGWLATALANLNKRKPRLRLPASNYTSLPAPTGQ